MDFFSDLNSLDYGILILIALFAIWGLKRGFVRSLMSLVIWLVAFLAGFILAPFGSDMFAKMTSNPAYQVSLAFVAIVICVLVIGVVINFFLKRVIQVSGLDPVDHVLGLVFGGLIGCFILTFLVHCLQLTPMSGFKIWRQSLLIPAFEQVVVVIEARLIKGHVQPKNSHQTSLMPSASVVPEHDQALN